MHITHQFVATLPLEPHHRYMGVDRQLVIAHVSTVHLVDAYVAEPAGDVDTLEHAERNDAGDL